MPLNLAPITSFYEKQFDDECVITRDAQLTGDDTWSDVTGTYTRPAGDDAELYDGPCLIWVDRSVGESEGGGEHKKQVNYFMSVPVDSGLVVQAEDKVTCTDSLRDPDLVGQEFSVDEMLTETFAVSRDIRMHRLSSVPQ